MENQRQIKKGDTIVIAENLKEELLRLGFDNDKGGDCRQYAIDGFCQHYVGTTQKAYSIWRDGDQEYVTIDLCVEIPIQSCRLVG